jgi:hypothetical protein
MAFRLKATIFIATFGSLATLCLSNAAPRYPDHCVDFGYPGAKSCPTPPLAVAASAIPDELQSWGVPAATDAKKSPGAYAVWYNAYFLSKRTVQAYGRYTVGRSSLGLDTSEHDIDFGSKFVARDRTAQ